MDLQVTGHNVEILPTLRDYLEKKMTKLSRHLPNIMTANIELTEQKTKSKEHRFVAEVTLDINGTLLRSEERAENMVTAIDKVLPVLDRQIEKYKGKTYPKMRASIAARAKPADITTAAEAEGPSIVRIKRFSVKPMTPEQAVNQMELLGHDFFLFVNPETKEVNLVYRRKDGNYSLIEPEVG